MSVSNFSAAQREQQQQNLKKFLALSFLASAVLHGVALPFSLNFVKPAEAQEEPIEFVVIEEPENKAVEPEPVAQKEVAPPPEPAKTETPEEMPKQEPVVETPPPPTPKEEPIVETPPPPIPKEEPVIPPKEEPVSQTPLTPKEESVPPTPLTPKEESVPPTPLTPKEESVPPTPLTPKEEPVPPTPLTPKETSQPPVSDSPLSPPADTSRETAQTDNSNPPPANDPPPPDEPPVTASPPRSGESTDFISEAPNPKTSENLGASESNSSPDRGNDIAEPLSEPFGNNSAPINRPPTTDPPVTAYRPGGGGTSSGFGDSLSDLVNPSSPDIPGGESRGGNNSNASSGETGNSDGIGSSEPFGNNSQAMDRPPRNTDGPVSAYRPGGSSSSGGGFPDLGDPGSSGVPGGEGAGDSGGGYNGNSSSGDAGSGDGIGSSEPFGGGIGAMPKPGGGAGGPSRGSGGTPGVCVRCNKPAYPISARRQKREGLVELLVNIDADGNVLDVSVATSSGHEDLDQAAMDGVRNWKFSSAESGVQGKLVTVRFDLND